MKRFALTLGLMAVCLTFAIHTESQEATKSTPTITETQAALWTHYIRGEHKALYDAALSALRGAHNDVEREIALELLRRASDELAWRDALGRDLDALIDEVPDEFRDCVRHERAEIALMQGDLKRARGLADETGVVRHWALVGPFKNDRGDAFDSTLDAETYDPTGQYSGINGQSVSWRRVPVGPMGVLDLAALQNPNSAAAALAVFAIHSETEGSARIAIASTSEYSLHHANIRNDDTPMLGREIMAENNDRPLGFDQESARVPLAKGWNRFVIKSGVQNGEWQLSVRLTTDVVWKQAADPLAERELGALTATNVPDLPGSAKGGVSGYIRELLAPRRDFTSRLARRGLAKWVESLPKETPAQTMAVAKYLLAWASASQSRVAAGREENARRELLAEVLKLDPKAARAAYDLAGYYSRTFTNPTESDRYATLAETLAPEWVEAGLFASRVRALKGLDTDVERELTSALAKWPDHPRLLKFAAYYRGLRADYASSNRLFARALKADATDSYSRARLLERSTSARDFDDAALLARDALAFDPTNLGVRLELAKGYERQGKFTEAETEVKTCIELRPNDDRLLERLGEIYAVWASSDPERSEALNAQSVDAYTRALAANPGREDIQRYLEFLSSEQPVFEAKLQESIDDRIEDWLAQPIDGNEPYEVLYDDQVTVINNDGTHSRYVQQAFRVLNDRGRENLQYMRIPAYQGETGRCVEARFIRKDASEGKGRKSRFGAMFPDLQTGDIVVVRYRISQTEVTFFGEFFGDIEVLREGVPVREKRRVYVLPKGRELYDYRTNGAPQREESTVEGRRVWTYRATDLSKIHNEPWSPNAVQLSPTIQISTYADWKSFGRWYYNLIEKQFEATPEMTETVNELTKGLDSEQDKARAVYEWVVRKVRYNADWHFGVHGYKPFSAGAVFSRCIGDCKDKAILICSMLRIAGVKAYPVIINLENRRGDEDISLPMPHHFNHCIAYIEFSDGSGHFVDGTTTYHGFNELPSSDAGANVIVVRPTGGEVVKIPTPVATENQNRDIATATINGKDLTMKITRTAVGSANAWVRTRFEREGDRKRSLEAEYAEYHPGATVSDITVNDLNDLNTPPNVEFTLKLKDYSSVQGKQMTLELAPDPAQWTQTRAASLAKRHNPLVLPTPESSRKVTTLTLPDGYAPKNLPKPFEHDGKWLKLTVTVKSTDKGLVITREWQIKGGVVPPEEYPAFRKALAEFDRAESATLTLTCK